MSIELENEDLEQDSQVDSLGEEDGLEEPFGDLDEESFEEEEPTPTRVPFYKTGTAKLALVGGVSFVVIVAVASLYTNLFSGQGGTTVVLEEEQPKVVPTPFSEEAIDPRLEKVQQEASEAKAKLALAEQRNRLSANQGNQEGAEDSTASTASQNELTPSETVSRFPDPPSPAAPIPTPPPPPPPPPPTPVPVVPPRPDIVQFEPPKPQEDPLMKWSRMSRLGKFTTASSDGRANEVLPPPQYSPVFTGRPFYRAASTSGEVTRDFPQPSQTFPKERKKISAGTTGKGRLMSSIIWAGDIDITRDTYAVELIRDFGEVPRGSILFVRPLNVSSAGLIRFTVIKIQTPEREIAVPDGAILAGGNGGSFLQARYVNKGEPGLLGDIVTASLSGAQQVSQAINQPTGRTTVTSTTGGTSPGTTISQTIDNKEPDLLAAFAQGMTGRLVQNLEQRIQSRKNAQPYFEVGKGREVDIIALQELVF